MNQMIESGRVLILVGALTLPPTAAISQDTAERVYSSKTFEDLPKTHWAYRTVKDLKPVGVELPIQDCIAYGRSKNSPLTRYEFAVVLDRTMKGPLCVIAGKPHASISSKVYRAIERLLKEFHKELNEVGLPETKAKKQLAALRKFIKKS